MSSLGTEFLQHLGYALCEYRGDGQFALLYDPPPWFQEIWGDHRSGELLRLAERSSFLEAFLSDAEDYWNSNAASPTLESGAWIERGSTGRDIPLDARASRVDGRRVLSIHSRHEEFQERTRVLQTARDFLLIHERLLKEIQKKEILLHCIIHDLSQPLTAMRGCFDVLAEEMTTPGSKRLVELGRQQSERQDNMIREVLQAFAMDIHASMDSGDATSAASNILACAEETVAAFGPVFQSQGAEIRLGPRVDRSASWSVTGDKSRLMRIFSNLVENALRHAPKGSTVTIGLEDDGGNVRTFVEDEGPGLPKEFKPSEAFALFSKGKEGGGKAGLGLYFCRITVERWGGSIGCESLPHRGARFWFRLPRAAVSSAAATSSPVSSKAGSHRQARLKILLAEDDPSVRELTGILLERAGHEVLAVASGLEAIRTLAKRRFDVVILDEEMPGMTGVEVTKAVRGREAAGATRQIIFALTGNATEEDRSRLLAAGFDECLGKPFRSEQLARILARFTGDTAETTDPKGPPASTAADSSLLARFGGDAKLLRSVAALFLKDYPAKVRKIKQAIARKNASSLASAAHALKGAVSIFGAEDAVEATRNLQQMGRQGSMGTASTECRKLDEALARLDAKLREYAALVSGNPSQSGRGKQTGRKSKRRTVRTPRRRR